ncbi:hypothetical protein ACFM35_01810 [Microbacterium sp. P01]|uniref:hypothetical protein n=1 Tax=Microbacterium sp. P01 TaxID=3366261 RepID=UPI003671E1BD
MSRLAQQFHACDNGDMVYIENVDVSDERIALASGVSVPRSWTIVVRGEEGVPGVIRMHVHFDEQFGRAVAAEVRVLRQGSGDEVTSLTLREVRVQHALQVSGLKVSTVSEPDHPVATGEDYIRRMRERTGRTMLQSVADAARTYQLAAALNLPPLRAVADGLGISQSTATRLMNRARTEGLAPGMNLPDPSATGPAVSLPYAGGPSIGR